MVVISIRDLQVKLGRFALTGINLDIRRGEYFVLLGPTGAGKTVLLETVVGLHRPAAGTICLDGRKLGKIPIHERGIGFVAQEPCLFEHKNVGENIAYPLRMAGVSRARTVALVEQFARETDVGHLLKQYPAGLSGGERQRVALARALIRKPECVLLDEPLSAIDVNGRVRMCRLLQTMHIRYRLTVLHVTHDFADTFTLADRIGVMNRGCLIETGNPRQLLEQPRHSFTAAFLNPPGRRFPAGQVENICL